MAIEIFPPFFTPPQITADQNDYDPTPNEGIFALQYRISSDTARAITGFGGNTSFPFKDENGNVVDLKIRVLYWTNVGGFTITLEDENVLSTARNRFSFVGGDLSLVSGQTITLLYDSASKRWRRTT